MTPAPRSAPAAIAPPTILADVNANMRGSFRIARISGIDVKLHFTFLLLPLLLGFSGYASAGGRLSAAVEAVVPLFLLFGCVLLHEFGHALAARHYGIKTDDITLLPIGGIARLERMPEEPSQELVVTLAGPAVNVAIILGLGLMLGAGSLQWAFTSRLQDASGSLPISLFLLAVNVKLLLFNLLPAFPMDGGRVLRALLATQIGYARATRIAAGIGQIFAVGFALAGLGILLPGILGPNWVLVLLAYFLYTAGSQEAASARVRGLTRHLRLSDAIMTDFRSLPAASQLKDAVDLLIHTAQRDFPVLDEAGKVLGVLTRPDLMAGLSNSGPEAPVTEVMRRNVPSVSANASFEQAFELMQSSGSPALPVVDHLDRLVGLITPHNVGEMMLVHSVLDRGDHPAWRIPAAKA